jgi:hypothetical protein
MARFVIQVCHHGVAKARTRRCPSGVELRNLELITILRSLALLARHLMRF